MIPKILHRIWLGGNEPDEVKEHWEIAKKLHPDWEHVTHSEENLDEFPLSKKYLDLHPSYSFKSDLIRFEALYKHGGFYIDTDVEVLKSFDDLCSTDKVVAAYEDHHKNIIGTATFGAPANNKEVINAFYYIAKNAQKESKSEKGFIYNPDSEGFGPSAPSKLWKNNSNCDILNYESFYILRGNKTLTKSDLDLTNSYSIHKGAGSWK